MPEKRSSLDEIMSKRQFSVKSTPKGDALTKIYKAPASWDDERRSARFIMTAEVKDRYGDIVVAKGADMKDFLNNPVVLWGHNSRAYPIGMWSDIRTINGQPKRIEGNADLAPEGTTEQADDVARLLAANMVRACSIGFMIKEWEAVDKDDPWGGWKFLEWELLECSICSVPANPLALVKAAGGDTGLALQAIELVLDEWARTPEGLIVPREQYERAYQVTRQKNVTMHEVRSVDEPAGAVVTATKNIVDGAVTAASLSLEDRSFLDRLKQLFGGSVGAKDLVVDAPDGGTAEKISAESITVRDLSALEADIGEIDAEAAAELDAAAEEEAAKAAAEAEAQRLADEQEELELRARAMALVD